MKLTGVDKFLIISIENTELIKYINSLDNIISHYDQKPEQEDIEKLKDLSIELTRIQSEGRDY